jgi:flagellar basal body-associated protein FliL
MAAPPARPSQNTGLIVLVVGIFMIIIAFGAVTYLNGNVNTVKQNQTKNSQVGQTERTALTAITCALWHSVGTPTRIDTTLRASVEAVCGKP